MSRSDPRCDRCRTELVALDRGELGAAEEREVRRHVADCAECARELRALHAAAELVAAATALEPTAAGSASLRAAVDAALVETARSVARPRLRLLGGAWEQARAAYEGSSAVRRFTIASIGLHAAAAVVLAALLASSSDRGTPPTFQIGPPDTADLPGERPVDSTVALPPFDAAGAEGVESDAAPGIRFPNRTTARRHGAAASEPGRAASLRSVLGDDAASARAAIERGLAWLDSARGADGSVGRGDAAFAATAATVLASASAGRTTAADDGLARSVEWLERNADGADLGEAALALRAVTAQYVMDFGHLGVPERLERAHAVERMAVRYGERCARAAADGRRSASDTVAAVAALADVRSAGVLDTGETLSRLVRELDERRTADGRISGTAREDGVALTAEFSSVAADAGARPISDLAANSLAARVADLSETSTADAARGAGALASLGRSVREPLSAVLRTQSHDGRWVAGRGGAPSDAGSDALETAYGVVALAQAYRR